LSPSPEHVEYAETLLRLADADLYACRVLADADDLADGAVGFHAQQAVEKALKLRSSSPKLNCPAPTTSNNSGSKVEATGAQLPSELAGVDWLTPWAVALRYDEPTALDRTAALALAESACSWAKAYSTPERSRVVRLRLRGFAGTRLVGRRTFACPASDDVARSQQQ
jgi:hypothetical protein